MLARLEVAYVIVGHSELRTLFGMDDAMVAAILRAVLRHQTTPVVCVRVSDGQHDGGGAGAAGSGRSCSRRRRVRLHPVSGRERRVVGAAAGSGSSVRDP